MVSIRAAAYWTQSVRFRENVQGPENILNAHFRSKFCELNIVLIITFYTSFQAKSQPDRLLLRKAFFLNINLKKPASNTRPLHLISDVLHFYRISHQDFMKLMMSTSEKSVFETLMMINTWCNTQGEGNLIAERKTMISLELAWWKANRIRGWVEMRRDGTYSTCSKHALSEDIYCGLNSEIWCYTVLCWTTRTRTGSHVRMPTASACSMLNK